MTENNTLQQQFGRIDIYLFDQIWSGNITPSMRIVDAGCGHGRNLVYLLREGAEIYGIDANPDAIALVRDLARALAPTLPPGNFQTGAIERMPYPDGFANAVLCNSVLHFAWDDAHFDQMVAELWRVLAPGGILFCRLASTIGAERLALKPAHGRTWHMPDGNQWYLVDEAMLMERTAQLGGELVDPLKTTVVQSTRSMTTWVVRKPLA